METPWKVCDEIVTLSRGSERILFNARQVNPVYLARGGEEVLAVLARLQEAGERGAASASASICSPQLFDFLCRHALVETGAAPIKEMCFECGCGASGGKSPSRSLYLLLCQSCNQACIYCYNGRESYHEQPNQMMSQETAFAAIEQNLDSIQEGGALDIVFFGGEPLLNWPLACAVLDYCEAVLQPRHASKKVRFSLTTNLTLFPDDLLARALRHQISFLIDVDGPPDIHNFTRPFHRQRPSLAVTAGNLRRLGAAGIDYALRATITSHNHHRLPEVVEFHRELGGVSSALVPLNAVDSDGSVFPFDLCPDPDMVAEGLRRAYRDNIYPKEKLHPFNEFQNCLHPGYRNLHGCGAPYGNTPVVSTNGKIFSCIYLVNNPRHEIGDLSAGDFPREEVLARLRDIVNIEHRSRCRCCGYRYLCGGGCPVGLFSIADNPNASSRVRDYTERMACVVAKTCLDELFWDLSRDTGVGDEVRLLLDNGSTAVVSPSPILV